MKTVSKTGFLLAASLLLAGCSDDGVDPAPPNMEGEWTVHNEATGIETTLELDQARVTLTGFWHRSGDSIRVSGDIKSSNEFDLFGQLNNGTVIFNAEATDGFSRFSGTISMYDIRGVRKSLQMVTGRR